MPTPLPPSGHQPIDSSPGGSVSSPASQPTGQTDWTARRPGAILLLAGWLLPQLLLLGPALIGQTVALPLDLLALPGYYLPNRPEYRQVVPIEFEMLTDITDDFSPQREFATKEFRAGRLPLWQPANFAGAPCATWAKYSPFEILHYLFPRPVSIAWGQLLQMLVFSAGLWLFLKRGLGLSYWPSAIVSWCAPLSGTLVLWRGFPLMGPIAWLPWLLFVVHRAVRQPGGWSGIAVAGVTALVILSGQSPMAGLVLLSSGLYVVWLLCLALIHERSWRMAAMAAAVISAGWLAGFSLAAPYLLPLLEFTATGVRIQDRAAGVEERPPEGLAALPALALPDVYGARRKGSMRIARSYKRESPSVGYAGLVALFWLAPLAWSHPGYRREAMFFTLLAIIGLGWTIDLPGLVPILRLWPLNMLSCNRWVFVTSSAILILTAIGLEQFLCQAPAYHKWFLIPVLATAGMGVHCLYSSAISLPEPLYSQEETAIRSGNSPASLGDLDIIKAGFTKCYAVGALLSLGALGGWLITIAGDTRRRGWRFAAVALLPAELFWFAANERWQGDRALYFPRIAALEKLSQLPPGRTWGISCLPPNLNQFQDLEDIRGYDGVDPARFVRLFTLACDPRQKPSSHTRTQWAVPLMWIEPDFRLHPVSDLLNVRYLLLRKPPRPDVPLAVHEDDYWVVENPHVLSRAFVPRSARVDQTDDAALAAMESRDFDPRTVAFVASDPRVPDQMEGEAQIHYETPTRLRIDVKMKTDGLVVVSDMWDAGWIAEVDGVASTIHRVNVALRGVRVPEGAHTLRMTYDPQSLWLGCLFAGGAALTLLVWAMGVIYASRRMTHLPEDQRHL